MSVRRAPLESAQPSVLPVQDIAQTARHWGIPTNPARTQHTARTQFDPKATIGVCSPGTRLHRVAFRIAHSVVGSVGSRYTSFGRLHETGAVDHQCFWCHRFNFHFAHSGNFLHRVQRLQNSYRGSLSHGSQSWASAKHSAE